LNLSAKTKSILRAHAWLPETLLLFAAIDAVNRFVFAQDPGFLMFPLHPYWIPVLLMAARYGLGAGLFAGTAALAHALWFIFEKVPARSDLERVIEAEGLLVPVAFVVIGAVLGGLRQDAIRKEQELCRSREELRGSAGQLESGLAASEKARRILESRIVGESKTLRTLYEAARQLEGGRRSCIYEGCLRILREYFRIERAVVYTAEGGDLIFRAGLGIEEKRRAEGRIALKESFVQFVFSQNRALHVRDLLRIPEADRLIKKNEGQPLALFPMRKDGGGIFGAVCIEKMDFVAFTPANLELIRLVVDWTSRAVCDVESVERLRSRLIMDEGDEVYNFRYFGECLEAEVRRAGRFALGMGALAVKIEGFAFFPQKTQVLLKETLVAVMRRTLADTDMLFTHRFEGIYMAICPMRDADELEGLLVRIREEFAGAAADTGRVCLRCSKVLKDPQTVRAQELMRRLFKEGGIPC